jgi:diketogulonate reductase-like aldo/keto reductase
MKMIQLNNNYEIPQIGFGTFKIDSAIAANTVTLAIQTGYRHIDCASAYGNEAQVGIGIKNSGVSRNDLFITSKVWNDDQGYDKTLKAFEKTCKDLQVDYLDLYMIHWPKDMATTLSTYQALEQLYESGKIKAIGVCNFNLYQLNEILPHIKYLPQVNQIELHPQFPQTKTLNYCKKLNIQVTAWASLMQGQIFNNQIILDVAKIANVTPSQVALKWALDQDIIVIPKSTNSVRMQENLQADKIILTTGQISKINSLDNAKKIGSDSLERK